MAGEALAGESHGTRARSIHRGSDGWWFPADLPDPTLVGLVQELSSGEQESRDGDEGGLDGHQNFDPVDVGVNPGDEVGGREQSWQAVGEPELADKLASAVGEPDGVGELVEKGEKESCGDEFREAHPGSGDPSDQAFEAGGQVNESGHG